MSISVGAGANGVRWHAIRNDVLRYIVQDNRTSAHDRTGANADSIAHSSADADPRPAPHANIAPKMYTRTDMDARFKLALMVHRGGRVHEDGFANYNTWCQESAGAQDGTGANGDITRDRRARVHSAGELETRIAKFVAERESRGARTNCNQRDRNGRTQRRKTLTSTKHACPAKLLAPTIGIHIVDVADDLIVSLKPDDIRDDKCMS